MSLPSTFPLACLSTVCPQKLYNISPRAIDVRTGSPSNAACLKLYTLKFSKQKSAPSPPPARPTASPLPPASYRLILDVAGCCATRSDPPRKHAAHTGV